MADYGTLCAAGLEHRGFVDRPRVARQGRPAGEVAAIVRLGSPQFPRRHGNPEDYLRRTLARAAFPAQGALCESFMPRLLGGRSRQRLSNSTGGR